MATAVEYEFKVDSQEPEPEQMQKKSKTLLQPSSSNTHEQKSYDSVMRKKKKKKKKKARADKKIKVAEENENSSMCKEKISINEKDICDEREKAWKKLRMEEMQLYLKYLETMLVQTKVISNAMDQRRGKRALPEAKEEEEDRVKAEDYPELAKFVKLGLMVEEAQGNWSVIGNDKAAMLQKKWIQIKDYQLHISLWKMDLIHDICSLINHS